MFQIIFELLKNVMPPVEKTPGFLQYVDVTSRIAFFIMTLFVGIVAFEGQSVLRSVADHEKRITKIEASQYTSSDAVQDMRQFSADLSELRKWIENSFPPDWLRADVQELKSEVAELRRLLIRHEMIDSQSAKDKENL